MIEEITATFINPPTIWPTRKSGKETNWIDFMICPNCEDVTWHDLLEVEDGFFYRCRKCNFETETTSNSTLEIVQDVLEYMQQEREVRND